MENTPSRYIICKAQKTKRRIPKVLTFQMTKEAKRGEPGGPQGAHLKGWRGSLACRATT